MNRVQADGIVLTLGTGLADKKVLMSQVPADLRYSKSHEWVRVHDGIATVGITDHAQHELTDVVFAESPALGRVLKAGEACAVVESVKTASDIYSPLSGEVVESNAALSANPALVNTAPYSDGWFFRIRLTNPAEVDALMSAKVYREQVGG